MGAEHLLAARATRPEIGARLLRIINRVETEAMALGLDIRGTQPSPGNIRGGLTTIEEKSLGATYKGGEHVAARGRGALRRAHHAQGPDRHGHAGARRRIGDRHGRRRRAGGRLHHRPGHADRQPDRAGDQDHGQRRGPRSTWPTISTSTSAAMLADERDARRGRGSAPGLHRRRVQRSPPSQPNASSTASSPSTGATPRSEYAAWPGTRAFAARGRNRIHGQV